MLNHFNPDACRLLRADLEKALKVVADKHGIQITIGKMGYTPNNVKIPLEAATVGDNGIANSREVESFKLMAGMYGLKPTDLGRTFKVRGEAYEICGLNTKKVKYAIQCKRTRDGASFGFPAETVQHALAA